MIPLPSRLLILILLAGADIPLFASNEKTESPAMKAIVLPPPIDRFVETVNRHDTAGFLAFFPVDGAVDDWGRRFEGQAAIKRWSDKEFIGAKGTITPTKVEQKGNQVTVEAGWKSSFFSGASTFIFLVEDDLIREMRIPAH